MHLNEYKNRIWATAVAMAPRMLTEKKFSLITFKSERRKLILRNLQCAIKCFCRFEAKWQSKAPSSYLMVCGNYSMKYYPLPLLELRSVPFVRTFKVFYLESADHLKKLPLSMFIEIRSSTKNMFWQETLNIRLRFLFLCLDCEHQLCKYCFDNLSQFH